jgi:hypothetical protein
MTRIRKAYVDIEATYCGDINPDGSQEDRDRFFKDYPNWRFFAEKQHNGKNVEYCGIIGILVLDFKLDEATNVYKVVDKKFVQLIGKEITQERLMKELDGITEIIGYHCRTKPGGPKGYTGYDFGVINGQLDIVLDDLPGVKSTDLELLAHGAGMYGGLKSVEMQVPSVPPRRSGIADGAEEEKLLHEIASCEDEAKRKEMWKKAKRYNREDVVNLVFIEQYLRKLKIVG